MLLTLHAPLFLLLLVVPCILVLTHGQQASAAPSRRRSALVLRFLSLSLLTLAIAQPGWSSTEALSSTVLVADASASISPLDRGREIAWLRGALAELPGATVRGLVVYAGGARLLSPSTVANSTSGLELGSWGAPGHTDIEQGLRLALGAVPEGGRVVLLSDGLQTDGDALSVGGTARMRHVVIDAVALRNWDRVDAAVTRLQAPSALHPDDALSLLLTIRSTVSRRALVTIRQDGRLISRSMLGLRVGDKPLLAALRAPGPGWHTYRAAVSMPGDTVRENNALEIALRVARPARVLVVGAPTRAQDQFAALAGELGIAARPLTPAVMPRTAAEIARYDGVVLDDVPVGTLTARQVAALGAAVRARGVGLLVLGGPHSLSLGGYDRTALDRLLPVISQPSGLDHKGNIGLQLILDRSGSMDNLAGDAPKIQMAQAAADVAVDFAVQHRDDLGIVSFDEAAHVLVPLQRASAANTSRLHQIVHSLTAQGGTNIHTALQTGLRQLLRSKAPHKHIVLMTDGVSEPAHYGALLALARYHRVTISTIGLGKDADVRLLRYLARAGRGRFYYTENARDLPRIFVNEARLSAGPARVLGTIPVALGSSSPVTDSLSDRLPPIHGYAATSLKAGAISPLIARARGSTDPLLAVWQYGLGRVEVWTPGFMSAWAGAWMTREPNLWHDATHWILRGVGTPTLMPRVEADRGSVIIDTFQNAGVFLDLARLEGSLMGGGRSRLTFEEVGPGHYQTALPDTRPGVYRLRVVQTTVPFGHVAADVALPYPQEYLPQPPALALLSELATETGGRLLHDPHELGAPSRFGVLGQDLWWPLATLALLLFLSHIALVLTGGRR